ncbi:MAG TPA: hypothetical protein VFD54_09750 [Anaerolineales bacterium]|nr:hypothetical protein [Anaerolineales bacterium]
MAREKILFISFLLLYAVSIAIVLMSSTAKSPLPVWGGYLDVGIVALIFINGFAIHRMKESRPDYHISYQAAVYLFPLILTGLWIYREILDFNILLPGLAWRTFFFFSILPYGLNLWKQELAQ